MNRISRILRVANPNVLYPGDVVNILAKGRAFLDGIDPGSCQVSFPDIDAHEWKAA